MIDVLPVWKMFWSPNTGCYISVILVGVWVYVCVARGKESFSAVSNIVRFFSFFSKDLESSWKELSTALKWNFLCAELISQECAPSIFLIG